VRCFSDQIFLTGFVHADPHPGNGKINFVRKKLQVLLAFVYPKLMKSAEGGMGVYWSQQTVCG